MSSCKPVDTPTFASKIGLQSGELFSDSTRFWQIISALQYLTFTRLDICNAVNKVCQFMHAPTEGYWAAVKHILRYLKGTTSFGLHLTRGSSLFLHGFTDADWADSIDDRKSIVAYIVFFNTTPVSWKSGKQRTVGDTAEILWLRYLLSDLYFYSNSITTIWCENFGATYLYGNPIFHAHTKACWCWLALCSWLSSQKKDSDSFHILKDQLANVLTKPLPHFTFAYLRSKLHVDTSRSAWRGVL